MSVASYHEFWCHHHRGQVWYLLRPLYAIVVALFHWCDPLLLFWDWIHCLELLFLHTKPYWSDPEFCLFCFPTHEWCCIPPVRYSQTNCVHAKYNMIILVEIEPAECHSDPYWYSLSGGGDQILKVILGGLTVCAQTHLMRPEVPAQCFNMDFVPSKNISNDWGGGAQWIFHRSRAVVGRRAVWKWTLRSWTSTVETFETLGSWTRLRVNNFSFICFRLFNVRLWMHESLKLYWFGPVWYPSKVLKISPPQHTVWLSGSY